MSVECSMLAVAPERCEALRADPAGVKDEVILRGTLGHLAGMASFRGEAAEAEVLAEIRGSRHLEMIEDPAMRRQMVELYAREDALVDAALARGDREPAFTLGTSWQYLSEILSDGGEPASAKHFFLGAPRFGEDVGYGPAGLHDPAAVTAFASYLGLWSPERFAAAAEARRLPTLGAASLPGMSPADLDAQLFLRFKTYILDAAAARAGMLIWMS